MRTSSTSTLLVASTLVGIVNAHLAAWHKGMYCFNGNTGSVDLNTASPVTPLYQLSKNDWWFHHINGCDNFPPADGDFLELPAGGDFTIEIASNRAKTSLSYNGRDTTDWPDGANYPEDYNVPSCITSPNMHTQNQSMAAGTAFAISYTSDIKQVTAENLAVFTVRYHTPWKRVTSYSVPSAMPACPDGGCICSWGWIPNGCGQPNMYHQAFRCKVTGATSTAPIASPKPPVWCEDDQSKCVKGAKQMLFWNQAEGNNIEVDGYDLSGEFKSPAYNNKCGFADGAQNDIFTSGGSSSNTGSSSSGSDGSKTATGGSSSSSGDSSSSNASSGSSNTGSSSSGSSNSGSSASGSSTSGPTASGPTNSGSSNSSSSTTTDSPDTSDSPDTPDTPDTPSVSVQTPTSPSAASTTSAAPDTPSASVQSPTGSSAASTTSTTPDTPSAPVQSSNSSSAVSATSTTAHGAPQCKRRSRRSRRMAAQESTHVSPILDYHKRHAGNAAW